MLLVLRLLLVIERPHTRKRDGCVDRRGTRSVGIVMLLTLVRVGILSGCVHAGRRLVRSRIVRNLPLARLAGRKGVVRTGHWRRRGQRRAAAVARPVPTAVTVGLRRRDLRRMMRIWRRRYNGSLRLPRRGRPNESAASRRTVVVVTSIVGAIIGVNEDVAGTRRELSWRRWTVAVKLRLGLG